MIPSELPIGTLLRTFHVTEERLAFLHQAGLECLQLAGCYDEWMAGDEGRRKSDWLFEMFEKYELPANCMFMSYKTQNWRTGDVGLTPAAKRAERMLLSCRQMNWAARRGIKLMTCHAGNFPADGTPEYEQWVIDMQQLCAFAAENGQTFLFETGPEPTAVLKKMITDIGAPNCGINFDPANLLIYNTDDPADFLAELKSYVQVVHCKDARRPVGDETSGRETVLGQGEAQVAKQLKTLFDNGFTGPLIIERELQPGPEQERDIAEAIQLLKSLRAAK